MNYGQVRDMVLKLLNQYTRAGAAVEPSYNNQQDYLNRIPALVNDAMMEIATTARKIPATIALRDLPCQELEGEVRYQLPEGFWQFLSGSVVTTREGRTLPTNCYTVQGRRYLLVPAGQAEDCTITCYRYPDLLPDKPADTDRLDNAPETHFAIPYYVASYLVAGEDSFLCALFYNKYEDKLAKMNQGVTAQVGAVADSYRFF